MKTAQLISATFCILLLSAICSCAQNKPNNSSILSAKPLIDFNELRTAKQASVVMGLVGECAFTTQDPTKIKTLISILEHNQVKQVPVEGSYAQKYLREDAPKYNISSMYQIFRGGLGVESSYIYVTLDNEKELVFSFNESQLNGNPVTGDVTFSDTFSEISTSANRPIHVDLFRWAQQIATPSMPLYYNLPGTKEWLHKYRPGTDEYYKNMLPTCAAIMRKQIYKDSALGNQTCGDSSSGIFTRPHRDICPQGWTPALK